MNRTIGLLFILILGMGRQVSAAELIPMAPAAASPATKILTTVSIAGERFLINGKPTYEGRTWHGKRIEGLLLNARMVQGIFDDLNPDTAKKWAYADTGRWDAERNTAEFIAAMPTWRAHGLLAFTINLQGGSPEGYSRAQPWINSAIAPDGSLRPAFMARLERIINAADRLGMVVILGYFYFGQDQNLTDEAAVIRGVDNATAWVLDRGWRNVIIEIDNECNVKYDHAILQPARVHELITRVQAATRDGRRLLVSTSYGGGAIPGENVVRAADFILIHGNGVKEPAKIGEQVRRTRQVPGYTAKPILFNEDDHFDFDKPDNNFSAAIGEYAGWGYFDFRMKGDPPHAGYQSVPVDWSINSPRKQGFFKMLAEITGAGQVVRNIEAAPGAGAQPNPAADLDLAAMIQPVPAGAMFHDPGYNVWCGSPVRGDDGKYHLFYSRWPRELSHKAWVTHSEVAHAVADNLFGPYKFSNVALPVRGKQFWDGLCTHNPMVIRVRGKYYLYYMGNTGDGVVQKPLNMLHRNNQRIGVAVADKPEGPWQRFDQPVLDVSPDPGAPDALMVSNPAVTERPDGGILMVYKAVAKKEKLPGGGPVVHLVATSDRPTGPFKKMLRPIFTKPGLRFAAEDPYIWHDGDRYRAVVKDNAGYFTGQGYSLALFESADGLDWQPSTHVLVTSPKLVRWADGQSHPLTALERPFLYRENGRPLALFCAAADREDRDNSFNIQIPLSSRP